MKTKKKRLLNMLVSVALLVSMVPTNVFATEPPEGVHSEETIVLEGKTPNASGQYEIDVPDLEFYEDSATISIKHTPKDHNCDDYFSYLSASGFCYSFTPAEPPMYPEDEEFSAACLSFTVRNITKPVYAAIKIGDNYYDVYGGTEVIKKPCLIEQNVLYYANLYSEVLQGALNTNYTKQDTESLDTLLDKAEFVVFSDETFNNKVKSYNWVDLTKTIYDCPGHSRGYTFNMYYNEQEDLCISDFAALPTIVYTIGDTKYVVGAQTKVNNEDVTIYEYDETTQTYTIVFDKRVFAGADKVYLSYLASDDLVERSVILNVDLEATSRADVVAPPEVKTVTVTPTVSVTNMPADGTKTEGFDITFKSDIPVVLTTQEAPDTSVCSITTEQSDGSYTGVYHVEVGNTDIKFNVKPTVASKMSDDGLTRTAYNSASYTLKIKAFAASYAAPGDITDEAVIPDDIVIADNDSLMLDTSIVTDTLNIEDSLSNNPGGSPSTGDSMNITLYLVIILTSITAIIFCIRQKKKAKKLLTVLLVYAMLGGIIGPNMAPTDIYAAPMTSTGQNGNIGTSVGKGDPKTNTQYAIGWFFTIMPEHKIDNFIKYGWQADTLTGYTNTLQLVAVADSVYNETNKTNQKVEGKPVIWVQFEESGDAGNVRYMCKFSELLPRLYNPTTITRPTPQNYVGKPNGILAKDVRISEYLNPLYHIKDNATKAAIANSLFNTSVIKPEDMAGKNIVCVPIFVYNIKGKYIGYTPTYHIKTGQPIYNTPGWKANWKPNKQGIPTWNNLYDGFNYAINTHKSLSFTDDVLGNKYYIEEPANGVPIKSYGGIGSIFLPGGGGPQVTTENISHNSYSTYVNYALDNKNTAVKTTTTSPTGKVTFSHNLTKTITTEGGVQKSITFGVGSPEYSSSLTGSFSTPSGTMITNEGVFNENGYAILYGSPTNLPYLEYKWTATNVGGIGNKYSLDITPKSTSSSAFNSVANYKSYLGNEVIPSLSNIKSYLQTNANAAGLNRFSNNSVMKFAPNLSSPVRSFFDATESGSLKTSIYNQASGKSQGIATATYTPVNVTSKIVKVDLKQVNNSFVIEKLTDGESKTYSNQSSTTFTTPAEYTYYKAVPYDRATLKVGDSVVGTGLTACDNDTLTVGSADIDTGYVIYCYKVPDVEFTIDVATYVKESYANNIDFVYNKYENGWKYSVAPKVSGSLNTIYNSWTSKINKIMAGCATANVDSVSSLSHQRTFMFNVDRSAYQTLNISPFISGISGLANTNGLAGVSAQVSTNKPGVSTMNSSVTVSGSAPNCYNNYFSVANRAVFRPTGSLVGQPNVWSGKTDAFTMAGFTFDKAILTYKNTTYVGVYTAPSISTQTLTSKNLVDPGKTYAEISNTGVKLSFIPHFDIQVMKVMDTTSPYNHSQRAYNNIAVMSHQVRSFNSAMLSGYRFDSLTPYGSTVSDYEDNSDNTLKGSDITLTVSDTGLRLNTYAYVLDIYGDGDNNEKINGYNPASEWGINAYSTLMGKVNAKFTDYLNHAQNNLEYSMTLDNEGEEYDEFTISKADANINPTVTGDSNVYLLTIKNGAIVNNSAYQNMLKQIKIDFNLSSTTEAETVFKNSGIVNMIMNSMHTNQAANNTSVNKWYDEGTNTICIRRFARENMKITSSLVVQDKADYDSKTGDAEWSLTIKNGSVVILDDEIDGADFEISDKTTQSN